MATVSVEKSSITVDSFGITPYKQHPSTAVALEDEQKAKAPSSGSVSENWIASRLKM
ncbi:MAG: hypothetical protein M4D80_40685 [Myxococcota bacterium]|nr:hypothetical protein [Myxococcota bacterium]